MCRHSTSRHSTQTSAVFFWVPLWTRTPAKHPKQTGTEYSLLMAVSGLLLRAREKTHQLLADDRPRSKLEPMHTQQQVMQGMFACCTHQTSLHSLSTSLPAAPHPNHKHTTPCPRGVDTQQLFTHKATEIAPMSNTNGSNFMQHNTLPCSPANKQTQRGSGVGVGASAAATPDHAACQRSRAVRINNHKTALGSTAT